GVGVPGDRLLEPSAERRRRAEPEELLCAADVEPAPGLPVRLRPVPDDFAVEAGQLRDYVREVADRDLLAGADVHRLGAVVALRREPDRLGAVVHVEELARGAAVAP